MQNTKSNRLFIKITRDTLPRIVDKYPIIYLEHGRMEVDDSSIKWIDSQNNVVRLPVSTISCILLGPGTSVTHEAVKVASAANCNLCWVGEDSLLFYAYGISPTSNSRNIQRQALLSSNPELSLQVAKAMFAKRFPADDIGDKKLSELMAMEGLRVKDLYAQKAQEYGVGWKGRSFTPGKFELSDLVNKILTVTNSALYAIISSVTHSLGYSPYLGFIHSGSPLPFIYDIADLYKKDLCVDLAFSLAAKLPSAEYNKYIVADAFIERVLEMNLLKVAVNDINTLIGEESARRYRK